MLEASVTVADLSSMKLAALLPSASVEISSRGHQIAELREYFAEGTDVTITFLPGDNYRHNVETSAALRRAGFNPVPHIAARELASREALNDFLNGSRKRRHCLMTFFGSRTTPPAFSETVTIFSRPSVNAAVITLPRT